MSQIFTKARGIWKNLVYVVWLVNHYIKVILADIFEKSIFITIDNGISNSPKWKFEGSAEKITKHLNHFCYSMQSLLRLLFLLNLLFLLYISDSSVL